MNDDIVLVLTVGDVGPASIIPGPPGPVSTTPGPPGPASFVPGPPGPVSITPGPPGPASIVAGPPGPSVFVQAGTGALVRTLQDKGRERISVDDFSTIDQALAHFAVLGGGTLFVPSGSTRPVLPQSLPNLLVEYDGPNTPHAMYDEFYITSQAAKLFYSADDGNHPGVERATVAIVSHPKGSGDQGVPASDFTLNLSMAKQNWPTTGVVGQTCVLNMGLRGGFHGPAGVDYYSAGDMGLMIGNAVCSSPNSSVSAYEAVTYYMQDGRYQPPIVGIGVQLGIIRPDQNLANGATLIAMNGACGNAIEVGNQTGSSLGNAQWRSMFRGVYDNGVDAAYEALVINRSGQLVMQAPPSVAGGLKTLRVGPTGAFEILNSSGTVLFSLPDAP